MNDHALDALLAEYAAPPVPAGLTARIAAAALALPQAPRGHARRAPRDRRGSWLRRPTIVGAIALGLAVGGALAASLAGLRIDWPALEAVFTAGQAVPEPAPPPRAAPPAPVEAAAPPASVEEAPAAAPIEPPPPAPPRATPPPPPAVAEPAPPPPDAADIRRIELPPPVVRVEPPAVAPAQEPRMRAPDAGDALRLRQQEIERTERLRAARQAQIERLQRVQQRRERLRRMRRD